MCCHFTARNNHPLIELMLSVLHLTYTMGLHGIVCEHQHRRVHLTNNPIKGDANKGKLKVRKVIYACLTVELWPQSGLREQNEHLVRLVDTNL